MEIICIFYKTITFNKVKKISKVGQNMCNALKRQNLNNNLTNNLPDRLCILQNPLNPCNQTGVISHAERSAFLKADSRYFFENIQFYIST